MPDDRLRILVIGLGSIGRRHVRLLQSLGVEVVGSDVDGAACESASREYGILTHPAPEAISAHYPCDGAIIATPTHRHVDPAVWAMKYCRNVLVEKPLAHTVAAAEMIAAASEQHGVRVLVGYSLRFHAGLNRLKASLDDRTGKAVRSARIWFGHYLPDWHPGQDYRRWYSCRRVEGGGVLMDASHEIDYACWLLGAPLTISAVCQNTGVLEIDCEDIADLQLQFDGGLTVSVHLDYWSREYSRGCELFANNGTTVLRWEFGRTPADNMYMAELQHFVDICRGEAMPVCTVEDGLLALRIVEAARRSSNERQVIRL